jgi:hypothetical protein
MTKKEEAIALRKQGKSYNEIHALLGIAKSTLTTWCHFVELDECARAHLEEKASKKGLKQLIEHNKNQTTLARERMAKCRAEGSAIIDDLNIRDLMLIGVTLYWGEGYKRLKMSNGRELTGHVISLTNSDPIMCRFFIEFLRKIMHISTEDIRIGLRLFKHIDEQEAIGYWSKEIEIPIENFNKSTYCISKSSLGKRPFNRLPYGTAQIIVGNTAKFHQLIGMIDGLQNKIGEI